MVKNKKSAWLVQSAAPLSVDREDPGSILSCRSICGLGPPVGIAGCEVGSRTLAVAPRRSRSPPVNGVTNPRRRREE